MKRRTILFSLAVSVWALPVAAHHSSSMHYITTEEITVEGVVTKFLFANPHMRIYFDVTSADGTTKNWMGEGEAASVMKRQGWDTETLKPGDHIKILGNPSRDEVPRVEWITIETGDGRVLAGGNGQERQRGDFFEQRRLQDAAQKEAEAAE